MYPRGEKADSVGMSGGGGVAMVGYEKRLRYKRGGGVCWRGGWGAVGVKVEGG